MSDGSRALALSTMWSQQDRFADLADFAMRSRELGYSHIEISYIVTEDGLARLRACGAAVTSLHAPAPSRQVRGRRNFELNLAASDEDERLLAIEHTKRTIDEAASFGASAVVVHLGAVGGEAARADATLRRLVREAAPIEETDRARRHAIETRRAGSAAAFDRARRSLDQLAAHARARGVVVGLENRYHYHEIPDVDEAKALLAGYPLDVVGYWHDTGHAEVLDRLGLVPLRRWLTELGGRCVGAHLHDVDGIVDHRAPGEGDSDWAYVAQGLPSEAIRTFEINQQRADDAVERAIPYLRHLGVI